MFLRFPGGSVGKESACNVGGWGSIPGLGRSPREGKGYPLQYFALENSKDCIVQGVAELDRTEQPSLSLWQFKFNIQSSSSTAKYPLKRNMKAHVDTKTQKQMLEAALNIKS